MNVTPLPEPGPPVLGEHGCEECAWLAIVPANGRCYCGYLDAVIVPMTDAEDCPQFSCLNRDFGCERC